MDINELESFKLSDAVTFHEELNPKLWQDNKLDPEVRDQLLLIAEDFVEYLGLDNLKVEDVTISGSNAAYSYTPHSDLDLHVLVDFSQLPNNEVYQELFTAKKTLYNDAHDITVRGVPVELYVQDTNQPVQSLGEYSIVHDKWIRIPKKRRANFDQAATKAKYEKLGDLIELALKTKDPKRVSDTIALVKRYRKSGLDKHGEFGPENLAYKAVRKQGLVQQLYDLKSELHGEKLSIDEAATREDALIKIKKLLQTAGRTPAEKENIKRIVAKMMHQWNIDPNEIGVRKPVDPLKGKIAKAAYEKTMAADLFKQEWNRFKKGIFAEDDKLDKPELTIPELAKKHNVSVEEIKSQLSKGIKVELEHTSKRDVAREIALDHIAEDPKYYDKLSKIDLEEAPRTFQSQVTPLEKLIQDYGYFTSFGTVHLDKQATTSDGKQQLLGLVQRLQKDSKSFNGLDKQKMEANRDIILNHIYQMMQYAIPILKKHLPAEAWEAKREPINRLLTAYNNARQINEEILDETAHESQLVNLISKRAAAEIFKMLRKKESTLAKVIAPDTKREKLQYWGISAEKLGVPYVNDPVLGSVLHHAKFIAADYIDRLHPKRVASYDPNTHEILVHYPAIVRDASDYGYETEQYLAKIIAHELQHAVDNFKSRGKAFDTKKTAYATLPYEINARFQEALMNMTIEFDEARKRGKILKRTDLPKFVDGALEHNIISQYLPKDGKRYKQLAKRAYKFFDAEFNNPKQEKPLSLGKRAINYILGKPTRSVNESIAYHVTPTRNLHSIMKNGLRPRIGDRSSQLDGEVEGIFLFPSLSDVEAAVSSWLGDEFDEDEELSLLAVDITGLENNVIQGTDYETIVNTVISPDRIKVDDSLLLETSAISMYSDWKELPYETLNAIVNYYYSQDDAEADDNRNTLWQMGFNIQTNDAPDNYENALVSSRRTNKRYLIPIPDVQEYCDKIYDERYADEDEVVTPENEAAAWDEGWNAHESGKPMSANPYKTASAKWDPAEKYMWDQGWQAAKEDPYLREASGYIPSAKEKNDPRFKTALTVDVKPDSIKKNAKAFNWKTSRAGIPPQARADGKIAEDLMKEWNSFLAEDQEQQELFPGYDEKHRQERLNAWLAKSQAVTSTYKPKVLYHATTKHFDQFRAQNKGFASALGMTFEVDRSGIFLAENPKFAAEYIEDEYGAYKENAVIIPVYLSAQYTFVLTDSGLSPMLNDEALVEEFKEHDIDLRSIYYHVYEDQRWELFDGPEGEEFVANLKKLGYDSAYMYESSRHLGRNGVWVAFEPSQVKAITNRGSFSPDDPRLMKENG